MSVEGQIHSAVVDLVAPGGGIERVHRFRVEPLPFPAKLVLASDRGPISCVVKASTEPGRLRREAGILRALADLDFAAPRVLAGPHDVATSAGPVEIIVMDLMPGEALPWIGVTDVTTAERTCQIVLEAIDQLHALTPRITAHLSSSAIPTRTLDQELADVLDRQSGWTLTPIFREAVAVLQKQVARHRRPLVFSNGDYNPLNVLADDAGLTGWVDFEFGCFEDPLIGLPKFLFWADDRGWSLGTKVGLVEKYLYRHRVPPAEFQVRVALRGLTHLHDTTPENPPRLMFAEIQRAIAILRQDG